MTGCMHGHPVTAQGREGSGPRATGGELQAPKLTGLGVPGPHEATLANVPTSRSRRGAPCWGSAQFRARGSCRHVALSKLLAPGLGLPSWVLEQPGWPRCPVHTVPSPSSVGSGVNAQRAGSTGRGGGGARLSPLFMVTTRRHLPLSPCRGPSRTPASVRGGPQPTSVHKHQGRGTEPPGSAPAGAWSSASPCWRPCAMTTEAAGSHWRLTQRPLRRAAQPDWACMARGGRDGQRPRPLAPPVSRAGQAPRDPGPRLLAQQPQREGAWSGGGTMPAPAPGEPHSTPWRGHPPPMAQMEKLRHRAPSHPRLCLEPFPLKPAGPECSGQRCLAAG